MSKGCTRLYSVVIMPENCGFSASYTASRSSLKRAKNKNLSHRFCVPALRKYFKADYCNIVDFRRLDFIIMGNRVKSVYHPNNR